MNFRLFLHHLMLFSSSMILDAFRIRRMSVYWDRTSDASQIWRNERDDWLYIDESLSIPTIFNVSIEPHTATVCVCVCVYRQQWGCPFFCVLCSPQKEKKQKGNCRKHFEWKCLWLLFLSTLNVWHIFHSMKRKRRLFMYLIHKRTDFLIVKMACLRQLHTYTHRPNNIKRHTYAGCWLLVATDAHSSRINSQ